MPVRRSHLAVLVTPGLARLKVAAEGAERDPGEIMKHLSRAALAAVASAALAMPAAAQTHVPTAPPTAAAPVAVVKPATPSTPAPGPVAAPSITPAMLHIPEGTELSLKFGDELSSASATVGDRFTIMSDDNIQLANGATLPAGLVGVGEITAVKKKGMMGQAGDLSVRLDYLKIGSSRVNLRGSQGGSGAGSVGATVALTVLFGPVGLLKHGHDAVIHKGQRMKAYVDQDVDVALPSTVPATGTATATAGS